MAEGFVYSNSMHADMVKGTPTAMSFKFNYYEQPEGKDAFGKVVALNKFAVTTGLAWSTFDVLMVTKPKGYLASIGRVAYNTGPLIGMATAFVMGTYTACNLRKKDDKINYAIGGYCAGIAYGSVMKSAVSGFVMGSILAIVGVVKKISIDEGWEFFPDIPDKGTGHVYPFLYDFTLTKERPRNWTTGLDD